MKHPSGNLLVGAVIWLIVSCLSVAPAFAQRGPISVPGYGGGKGVKAPPSLPKAGPTPRTTGGHPNFSGVWFAGFTGTFDLTTEGDPLSAKYDAKATPQERPSFQRWVLEKRKKMGPLDDARTCLDCEPLGAAKFFIGPTYPIELVQTSSQLITLAELDTTYRIIWIDGRPHQKNPDPQFNGDAVGHWEGDTLVVDVIGLDVHQWLGQGWFISDVAHLTERFSRPDTNTFLYQVTLDDPKVLTHPWKSAPQHFTIGQQGIVEYYCTNNKDYDQENPTGPKYISASGLDERYFDEQEYEQMKQQFPETATDK